MSSRPLGHLLVDHEIRAEFGRAILSTSESSPLSPAQVQPASLGLRLGPVAYRMRAGFLPGEIPLETRIEKLSIGELSLEGPGAVLKKGLVYLAPLEEGLALPDDLCGRFNPRSSRGPLAEHGSRS